MGKLSKNWFTVQQISERGYALAEFSHWERVVSYLVIGKTKAILFDTGMGYGNIKKEIENLTRLPVEVYLTHSHWDHIGGVNLFDKVWVFGDKWAVKRLRAGFDSGFINELNNQSLFSEPFKVKRYQCKGIEADLLIDGEVIGEEDLAIKVIHTPGHTPDSVCYLLPEDRLLISGDVIYPGPLYAQLDESCFESYVISVGKLRQLVNDSVKILPGHNQMSCDYHLLEEIGDGLNQIVNNRVIAEQGGMFEEYQFNRFSIIKKVDTID